LPLVLSDGMNDYLYGPNATPVEQVSLATSTPTYMTYTPADDTWLTTNPTGDETGLWGYDAFGNLAFGNPINPFGYSGQYADATTSLVNDRARWYQPQTGGFTTRDPAFAQTDQAYAYAGGDPVNRSDPTGNATVGICGGGAAGAAAILGVGIEGQVCLTRTVFDPNGEDDIGITETLGASVLGYGSSYGIGISYQVSNAQHLQDLAHVFHSVDLSVEANVGLSGSIFWGGGASGQAIYGINGGVVLGDGTSALVFTTNTWVQQAHGGGFLDIDSGIANTLRGIWDALVPGFLTIASNVYNLLSVARSNSNEHDPTRSTGSRGPC
jgi:RHS repeat-associated protein